MSGASPPEENYSSTKSSKKAKMATASEFNMLSDALDRRIQLDPQGDFFQEYLFTPRGREEIRDQNENHLVKLWSHAIIHGPREAVELLLDTVPQSLGLVIDNEKKPGITVVHYAIPWESNTLPSELLLRMISLAPEEVFTRHDNKDDQHLLHYAVDLPYPPMLYRDIYNKYPNAIYKQNRDGRSPLHTYLKQLPRILPQEAKSIVKLLLGTKGEIASVKDNEGVLPFQIFFPKWLQFINVDNRVVNEIAQMIIDAYPEAIESKYVPSDDDYRNRKLHFLNGSPLAYACGSDYYFPEDSTSSSDLLRTTAETIVSAILFFIKNNPASILKSTHSGYTDGRALIPFQLVQNETLAKTLGHVVNHENHQEIRDTMMGVRDDQGNNVLHVLALGAYASSHDPYVKDSAFEGPIPVRELTFALIEAMPTLTFEANEAGVMPLHVCCLRPDKPRLRIVRKYKVVHALIEASEECAREQQGHENIAVKTIQGFYPFMLSALGTSAKTPCLSSTYFLLQRVVALHGGLSNL